jgi:hypothetical protein
LNRHSSLLEGLGRGLREKVNAALDSRLLWTRRRRSGAAEPAGYNDRVVRAVAWLVGWLLVITAPGWCAAAPADPQDNCPTTAAADGLAQQNRDARARKLAEQRRLAKPYLAALEEARAHFNDYARTVDDCLLEGLATKAIIAMLAPEAEAEVAADEAGEAWTWAEQNGLLPPKGLELIAGVGAKLAKGEDPVPALTPEQLRDLLETGKSMEKAQDLFRGAAVAQLKQSIDGCWGTVQVPAEMKISAGMCVESFKTAADRGVAIAALAGAIRQLDADFPGLQYGAYAACVARARCKGTPESACDAKRPPGDWPDVP